MIFAKCHAFQIVGKLNESINRQSTIVINTPTLLSMKLTLVQWGVTTYQKIDIEVADTIEYRYRYGISISKHHYRKIVTVTANKTFCLGRYGFSGYNSISHNQI